ncbi:MAG: diguanylate cyclase [Alcaligenaceae bacterium]|nr:diguanylate cyclase [Alcaligenaceae bacterium]
MHGTSLPRRHAFQWTNRYAPWAMLSLALVLLALLLAHYQYSTYRALKRQNAEHLTTMARIAGRTLELQLTGLPGRMQAGQAPAADEARPDGFNESEVRGVLESVRYAPDVWSALIREDGRILLMQAGSSVPAAADPGTAGEFFRRHQRGGQRHSFAEGKVPRIGGMQTMSLFTLGAGAGVAGQALTVVVGRDAGGVLATWYRTAWLHGSIFLLICLGAVFGLRAYRRRQAEYAATAAQAQADLRRNAQDYGLIVEHTTDMVARLDAQGRIVHANPALCELLGKSCDALAGSTLAGCLPEDEKTDAAAAIAALRHPPHTAGFRHSHPTAKGIRQLYWSCQGLAGQDGQLQEIIAIGRDVTDHANQLNKLELLARQDFLTRLPNRRHFFEQCKIEVERARRFKSHTSLLLIDLDHFKSINDAHGYKVGDRVLAALGETLRASLRKIDVAGRVGGDEFAAVLAATNADGALRVAQRLAAAFRAQEITTDGGAAVRVTMSIGIATADYQDCSLETLLKEADHALQQAKRTGRDKICVADAARSPRRQADRAT